jgi:hypothetical protein
MLTRLKIESVKPSLKRQRLFDGRGLYLEIAPSGGRWWRFKYRFERKEKRICIDRSKLIYTPQQAMKNPG